MSNPWQQVKGVTKPTLKPAGAANTNAQTQKVHQVNFDLVQKNSRNQPDSRRITGDSALNSGKMTPKRQPQLVGFMKSQEVTEQNSPVDRIEEPEFTAPEGAYDEELKDFPEPLQTELQYLIDARVATMVH